MKAARSVNFVLGNGTTPEESSVLKYLDSVIRYVKRLRKNPSAPLIAGSTIVDSETPKVSGKDKKMMMDAWVSTKEWFITNKCTISLSTFGRITVPELDHYAAQILLIDEASNTQEMLVWAALSRYLGSAATYSCHPSVGRTRAPISDPRILLTS